MDNKIDMNDIYVDLDGLVSVLTLVLESIDEDLSVTRQAKDTRDIVAFKVNTADRVESLFLPALSHVLSALSTLFRRAKEATE